MSDSNTVTSVPTLVPAGQPSDETLFKLNRLQYLEARRREIEEEIVALTKLITIVPTPVSCLRCGHSWEPYNPFIIPRCCPRCGSKLWNKPPTEHSRKPSDPPARSWRKRVGGASKRGVARNKFTRNKVLWKQTDAPTELPHWLDKIVNPAGKGESGTEIAPLTPPPGIETAGTIPPPPAPEFVGFNWEKGEYEPQPELVASHPRDTEEEVMPSESDAPTEAIYTGPGEEAGGEPSPPADVTSSESPSSSPELPETVPPETVGAPQTDAEREELARAKEEAWPTTKPD